MQISKQLVLMWVAFLFVGLAAQAGATPISIGGNSITPIDPDIDASFIPTGTADFRFKDGKLMLVLTSTSPAEPANWAVLMGVTFDIAGALAISLTPISATAESLINPMGVDTDVEGQWAFKDDIAAGNLGSYGVSAAGDILGGIDTFGNKDCFADFGQCDQGAPNGADYGILGSDFDESTANKGLLKSGPHVQSSMTFLFSIDGDDADLLDMGDFENVQALYGTVGATVIPEPSTALLFSIALLAVGARSRRRSR